MTETFMRSLQYTRIGAQPEIAEVPVPRPGEGEVLLRVLAAGACHSDLYLMNQEEAQYRHGLPLSLGHEGAGVVTDVGPGVDEAAIGESVLIHGAWGCGLCRHCAAGYENRCTALAEHGVQRPGLGGPGTMAEYLVVPQRHLVPLGDLSPVDAVPLTDAGLTSFHAIAAARPRLTAGSTALVIGVGGLGHLALQILRATTEATIIAIDRDPSRVQRATTEWGAHHGVVAGPEAARRVMGLTDGLGADMVLELVANDVTLALARESLAMAGDLVLVGVGTATLPLAFRSLPVDARVHLPFWGTHDELAQLVRLAHDGHVVSDVTTFSLDEAPRAYELLAAGEIPGRAVIVP